MDPAQITLILNIVVYVLIGLIVLKMIFGLFKGVWKSLTAFIISSILYVIIIVFNTKFAELYYGINLTSLNLAIGINGQVFPVTTIGETLRNIIIYFSSNGAGLTPSSEAFVMCDKLATSIIALVVFILHFIIVCFIISPLLSFLIYNLLIKHLLGKNLTQKHKIRVGGFFVGGVKALVSSALLLMPFTALASNVVNTVNQFDFELNNSKTKALQEYVDAYKNSLLGQTLTSLKVGDTSLDIQLASYLTSFKLGDETTSLFNEMEVFLNIACLGIQEGVIDLSNFSFNQMAALSEAFVTGSLDLLANSPFVTSILPVALSIVVNIDQIKDNVDLSAVNWNDIDWSDELLTLSDIYDNFYETGLISQALNPQGIESYTFSRENYTSFKLTFENLDGSSVLNKVMPYLLTSLATYVNDQANNEILPEDTSAYQNIDLGNELLSLYDTVINLSDLALYSPIQRNLTVGDFMHSNEQNSAIMQVINYSLTEEAINGEKNDGTELLTSPTSIDQNRYHLSTKSLFDGVYKDDNTLAYKGILDSELLLSQIGNVLKYATSFEELQNLGLSQAIDEVAAEVTTKEEWSHEISSLLDTVHLIYNNPDFPLQDIIDNKVDILKDEKIISILQEVSLNIDDSQILSICIPDLIENQLGNQELIYGLTFKDLNFDVASFGQELYNLLDLVPDINALSEALSSNDPNAFLDKTQFDVEKLGHILKTVEQSPLINPQPAAGEMSNFETVLYNIFQDQNLTNMGFAVSENTITSISDWDAEIDNIVTAFTTLQDSSTIKNLINAEGENIDLNKIDSQEIQNIFSDLASSTIISSSMGNILNYYLQEPLKQSGLKINFNNVSDWDKEASEFVKVIDAVKAFGSDGMDLANINIASLDAADIDNLSTVLKSVYNLSSFNSEFVNGKYEITGKPFAEFFYDNVTSKIEESLGEAVDSENVKEDHISAFAIGNAPTEEGGEIDKIMNLLKEFLKEENGEKIFFDSNGNITFEKVLESDNRMDVLSPILTDFNEIDSFRTLFSSSLNKVFSTTNFAFGTDNPDTTVDERVTVNDLYFEAFSVDYNYKDGNNVLSSKGYDVSRSGEIAARQDQIDIFMDIADPLMDLLNNDGLSNGLESLKGDMTNVIAPMLKAMEKSAFTNNSRKVKNIYGEDLTFFEQMINFLMDTSGLDELAYNQDRDTSYSSAEAKMVKNISKISDWDKEIDNITSAVNATIKMSSSIKDFNDLSNAETLKALNAQEVKDLLVSVNHSSLYHDALPKIFDQVLTNINGLIVDENVVISGYAIEDKTISQEEKINLWDEDISTLCDGEDSLFEAIKGGVDSFFVKNTDDSGNITSVEVNNLSTLFNLIGKLHTFDDVTVDNTVISVRSSLIYGALVKADIADEIWVSDDKVRSNQLAEEMISYIVKNHIEDESLENQWAFEGERLEYFINNLYSSLFNNGEIVSSITDVSSSLVDDLFNSVYTLNDVSNLENVTDKDLYNRAYLLSEVLARLLDRIISQDISTQDTNYVYDLLARTNDAAIDNDYITFNTYENDGLKGLIDFAGNMATYIGDMVNKFANINDEFYVGMANNISMMGNKDDETFKSIYIKEEYYLNSMVASIGFESLITPTITEINKQLDTLAIVIPELANNKLDFSIDLASEVFADKADNWTMQLKTIADILRNYTNA